MGQNQWYHFKVGAPPILVYFSGNWDVHWGYDLDFDPWPGHFVWSCFVGEIRCGPREMTLIMKEWDRSIPKQLDLPRI